jgi:SRSO17 transposase
LVVIATVSRAPGAQQKRLAAYLDSLAQAAGHSDRIEPFKAYCTGLLLPGERKSVEPMAARLAPHNIRRMHQSLHHLVADAPWDDEAILDRALDTVLPAMLEQGPVVAWVVDDTSFPKKGEHSVGVARQYCGQVGKQENGQVAVSLSVSTEYASQPIAFRLYLPQLWANDAARREKAGVPEEVEFQTKPQIALAQIKRAQERGVPAGVILSDAAYGNDSQFRAQLTQWDLTYVVGIQSGVTVWKPGEQPSPAGKRKAIGRPPKLLRRNRKHKPVAVKDLALSLPKTDGRRSPGGRELKTSSRHASPACVCDRRIGITGAPNRIRKNGFSSNGPKTRVSPRSTGLPRSRPTHRYQNWSIPPNIAGSSNETTRN